MSRALQLARRGLYTTHPNPGVGCVLVRNGSVVGEGWHRLAGGPHAEIMALEAAGPDAADADCYVTLEPCSHSGRTPPCTDALLAADIGNVFIATPDPNPLVAGKGIEQLEAGGITVYTGLLKDEAKALNAGFEMRMRHGRPFVRCKQAMSTDGRTAMADGESRWITGEDARHDVQHLRARSSAIMTGINTVLADDPLLTVREIEIQDRRPLRVILDRRLRTPPEARILDRSGEVIIFATTENKPAMEKLIEHGAEIIVFEETNAGAFLNGVLQYLAREKQVNDLLLEAGPMLSGAMLSAGLVDEILLYLAPVLLGHTAMPLFELPAIRSMQDKVPLRFTDIRMIGQDLRLTLKPQATSH